MEACTVTAPDAITAFAVPNPDSSSQSQPLFSGLVALQVALPSGSLSLFRIDKFYVRQSFRPSTRATLNSSVAECQRPFPVQIRVGTKVESAPRSRPDESAPPPQRRPRPASEWLRSAPPNNASASPQIPFLGVLILPETHSQTGSKIPEPLHQSLFASLETCEVTLLKTNSRSKFLKALAPVPAKPLNKTNEAP